MSPPAQPASSAATDRDSLLVNFYFDRPVGHAIEPLRYALGYHRANPDLRISLVLNRNAPTELAGLVSYLDATYTVGEPFDIVRGGDAGQAIAHIPRDWTYVVDETRREDPRLRAMFPGMAAYYDASDRHFQVSRKRGHVGFGPPAYLPHQQVVLDLPEERRERARRRLGGRRPLVAVMLGGSVERSMYPSTASWERILLGLAHQHPGAAFCLVGKLGQDDGRTGSRFTRAEVERLLRVVPDSVDAFDLPLLDQLAHVEACDVFVSPHTGFGMAVLAVGTPWLTLSGNRWPEYFYNGVPFYSVLPDPGRFPCYNLLEPDPPLIEDRDGEGPRSPSMSADRIDADLDELLQAAGRLIERRLPYEQAMSEHFDRIQRFFHGRPPMIYSVDGIHRDYVDPSVDRRSLMHRVRQLHQASAAHSAR
jgi:hypothetical protein